MGHRNSAPPGALGPSHPLRKHVPCQGGCLLSFMGLQSPWLTVELSKEYEVRNADLCLHVWTSGGKKGLGEGPQNVDHREVTQTHAISTEAKAPLCHRLPEGPLPHGGRGWKGPRRLAWLSGGFQLGGLCCPQTRRDLKHSSRTGRQRKGVCVCVFVRKHKTPTLCFPRGVNYSGRGGSSGRVPRGQSNLSSGLGEREAGHGAERGTRPARRLSQPPRLLRWLAAHGACRRELIGGAEASTRSD